MIQKRKDSMVFGRFKWVLLIALLTITTAWDREAFAQADSYLEIGEAVISEDGMVEMVIYPQTSRGYRLEDLDSSEVTLMSEGQSLPITVDAIVDGDQPLSMVVLIDASETALSSNIHSQLKEAAIQFRQAMDPRDELGVVIMSSDLAPFPAEELREFKPSTDGGGAINFINLFSPQNSRSEPPLYDSVYRSVQTLQADSAHDQKGIIILTSIGETLASDGLPRSSVTADIDIALFQAQQAGIPLFVFQVGENQPAATSIPLRKLALLSGGRFFGPLTGEQLGQQLLNVPNSLRSAYRITAPIDPGATTLTLSIDRPDYVAQTEIILGGLGVSGGTEETLILSDSHGQILTSRDLAAGISGSIHVQPELNLPVLNPFEDLARVDYYLDDELISSAADAPFDFVWQTGAYASDASQQFRVELFDTAFPPQKIELTYSVLIEPCSLSCRLGTLAQNSTGWLIGLSVLVLALAGVFWIRRAKTTNLPKLQKDIGSAPAQAVTNIVPSQNLNHAGEARGDRKTVVEERFQPIRYEKEIAATLPPFEDKGIYAESPAQRSQATLERSDHDHDDPFDSLPKTQILGAVPLKPDDSLRQTEILDRPADLDGQPVEADEG